MKSPQHQVVDLTRLSPAVQGRSVEYWVNAHAPELFTNAAERMRPSNGVSGLQLLHPRFVVEPLQWCMIATTGEVVLWTDVSVVGITRIPGAPMEHELGNYRNPPIGSRLWAAESRWFDFFLDATEHRLDTAATRCSGGDIPAAERVRVTAESMRPWLEDEVVEWMGISVMGGIELYTRSRVLYLWAHLRLERLIILPRSPPPSA